MEEAGIKFFEHFHETRSRNPSLTDSEPESRPQPSGQAGAAGGRRRSSCVPPPEDDGFLQRWKERKRLQRIRRDSEFRELENARYNFGSNPGIKTEVSATPESGSALSTPNCHASLPELPIGDESSKNASLSRRVSVPAHLLKAQLVKLKKIRQTTKMTSSSSSEGMSPQPDPVRRDRKRKNKRNSESSGKKKENQQEKMSADDHGYR